LHGQASAVRTLNISLERVLKIYHVHHGPTRGLQTPHTPYKPFSVVVSTSDVIIFSVVCIFISYKKGKHFEDKKNNNKKQRFARDICVALLAPLTGTGRGTQKIMSR
jgi:hypothetical protein